jgi:cytosine deaminase
MMNNIKADLLFRNAYLEESLTPVDLAIKDGAILAIESGFREKGDLEIDATGLMVSTMFIDPHHHLDCAYLHEPVNYSGTLQEAIEINASIKADRTYQEIF